MPGQLTSANAVSATLVQLATGAGIAVGALLPRVFEAAPLFTSGWDAVLGAAAGVEGVAAYRGAFLAIALLMLLCTADSLMLHHHAGAEVSRSGRGGRRNNRERGSRPWAVTQPDCMALAEWWQGSPLTGQGMEKGYFFLSISKLVMRIVHSRWPAALVISTSWVVSVPPR